MSLGGVRGAKVKRPQINSPKYSVPDSVDKVGRYGCSLQKRKIICTVFFAGLISHFFSRSISCIAIDRTSAIHIYIWGGLGLTSYKTLPWNSLSQVQGGSHFFHSNWALSFSRCSSSPASTRPRNELNQIFFFRTLRKKALNSCLYLVVFF